MKTTETTFKCECGTADCDREMVVEESANPPVLAESGILVRMDSDIGVWLTTDESITRLRDILDRELARRKAVR